MASGLDLKLTVVFDSKENRAITDKLVILTDHAEVELPINVYPQVAKLQFEPFLNMGFARTATTVYANWTITNSGEMPVDIMLVPLLADSSAKLTISAEKFSLQGK